ncbi:MAG: DNA polymerase III subunit alpha, partial [bacterium]|nr:DNA polymerase III subunit alpha [bacterium]
KLMAELAGYGFAKSHSTAYALITYQTAYLKANHPREYMAALLTTESGSHDKLARYIGHCRQLGVEVPAPDVNQSVRDFTVVEEGIRFGLAAVKNVGDGAIESILEARAQEGGPYENIFDFAARIDGRRVNRRVVESLVKCGAFDSLHPNRNAVWCGLDVALEAGAAQQRDREIGQESLFGDTADHLTASEELPDVAPWTDQERLGNEKEVLGFYVTGHPLEAHLPMLARFTDVTATTVAEWVGREVRIGGLITSLRETRTRRGQTMAFGKVEDLEGGFELVIFANSYVTYRDLLRDALESNSDATRAAIPLIVSGTLESAEPPKLLVRDVFELSQAEERLAACVHVRILAEEASRDRLSALNDVLQGHAGDCNVWVHMMIPGESETVMALPESRGVEPTQELVKAIDGLFGRAVSEVGL